MYVFAVHVCVYIHACMCAAQQFCPNFVWLKSRFLDIHNVGAEFLDEQL